MLASQRRGLTNPRRDLFNRLRLDGWKLDRSAALGERFQDLDLKEQLRCYIDSPLSGIANFWSAIPYAASKLE